MCLGVHLPLLGSSRSHSYFDFEQDARTFMSSTCTLFIVRSGHQISNQGLGRPQHWPTDWSTEYRTGQLACKQEKASPRLADCAIKPPKSRTQSALVKFTANSIRPRSVGATTNPHNHARWPLATLGSRPWRRPTGLHLPEDPDISAAAGLPCQGEPHSHSSLCPISGDPGVRTGLKLGTQVRIKLLGSSISVVYSVTVLPYTVRTPYSKEGTGVRWGKAASCCNLQPTCAAHATVRPAQQVPGGCV